LFNFVAFPPNVEIEQSDESAQSKISFISSVAGDIGNIVFLDIDRLLPIHPLHDKLMMPLNFFLKKRSNQQKLIDTKTVFEKSAFVLEVDKNDVFDINDCSRNYSDCVSIFGTDSIQ